MPQGINQVQLLGYVGDNPELRIINGLTIVNLSVATGEKWKDKNGNAQESVEWHKIKFYRRLAEIASKYIRKGARVHIEGKLKTRKYLDKGVERYITEIIGQKLLLLSFQKENNQNQDVAFQGDYDSDCNDAFIADPTNDNTDKNLPF